MQHFTNVKLADIPRDIHYIYGLCNGNAVGAVQEYRRRFPQLKVLNRRVFEKYHKFI